jgi:FixJ family two-component response regulator
MHTQAPIILVVDDDPSICSSLKRLLRSAGYQVQTFESPEDVFSRGRPKGPCCLILDFKLPNEDGLHFYTQLLHSGVQVPVIFISGHASIPVSVEAMKSGAIDFLPKPFDDDNLLERVATAIDRDERALRQRSTTADLRMRYASLTPREREVFAAVTSGLLNKQIGAEMGIAEKTIKVHRARVMEKMAAETIADLVRMADILDVRWECVDEKSEPGEMPGTGFSSHQEQIALLAASRARALVH